MPVNTSPQALDNREQILHGSRGRRKDVWKEMVKHDRKSFLPLKWLPFSGRKRM